MPFVNICNTHSNTFVCRKKEVIGKFLNRYYFRNFALIKNYIINETQCNSLLTNTIKLLINHFTQFLQVNSTVLQNNIKILIN